MEVRQNAHRPRQIVSSILISKIVSFHPVLSIVLDAQLIQNKHSAAADTIAFVDRRQHLFMGHSWFECLASLAGFVWR